MKLLNPNPVFLPLSILQDSLFFQLNDGVYLRFKVFYDIFTKCLVLSKRCASSDSDSNASKTQSAPDSSLESTPLSKCLISSVALLDYLYLQVTESMLVGCGIYAWSLTRHPEDSTPSNTPFCSSLMAYSKDRLSCIIQKCSGLPIFSLIFRCPAFSLASLDTSIPPSLIDPNKWKQDVGDWCGKACVAKLLEPYYYGMIFDNMMTTRLLHAAAHYTSLIVFGEWMILNFISLVRLLWNVLSHQSPSPTSHTSSASELANNAAALAGEGLSGQTVPITVSLSLPVFWYCGIRDITVDSSCSIEEIVIERHELETFMSHLQLQGVVQGVMLSHGIRELALGVSKFLKNVVYCGYWRYISHISWSFVGFQIGSYGVTLLLESIGRLSSRIAGNYSGILLWRLLSATKWGKFAVSGSSVELLRFWMEHTFILLTNSICLRGMTMVNKQLEWVRNRFWKLDLDTECDISQWWIGLLQGNWQKPIRRVSKASEPYSTYEDKKVPKEADSPHKSSSSSSSEVPNSEGFKWIFERWSDLKSSFSKPIVNMFPSHMSFDSEFTHFPENGFSHFFPMLSFLLPDAYQGSRERDEFSTHSEPYDTLGVLKDATNEDIRKAYYREALRYHPDRMDKISATKTEANEKMAHINRAYETLSDPNKRAIHDNKFLCCHDFVQKCLDVNSSALRIFQLLLEIITIHYLFWNSISVLNGWYFVKFTQNIN